MRRRDFLKGASLSIAVAGFGSIARAMAAKKGRPNILFFFPDQHRFDWVSMNPDLPDISPNLKKIADAGVNFTKALCPAPVCAPSRACLASGKEYENCRVSSNRVAYPEDQVTFYKLLRRAGYAVLGCGKFDLDKPGFSWGRDGKHPRSGKPSMMEAWGFTDGIDNEGKKDGVKTYAADKSKAGPYFAYLEKNGLIKAYQKNLKMKDHAYDGAPVLPAEAYNDNWIAQNGLDLINSVPAGQPWFLQINFNGPHSPMDITKDMYDQWKGTKFPEPKYGNEKENDSIAGRRNYGAMIHNIDRWLGLYIDELKRRGELENTLIVYSSDHGDMLGTRGMSSKSKPFHASASVPFVISGLRVRKGITCDGPTETLDAVATFLDYAGVEKPADMDSRSLRPFLEGRGKLPRDVATSSLGEWSLVYDGRYKLIGGKLKSINEKYDDPEDDLRLYDLEKDPIELNDLSESRPEIVKRLKPLMPTVAPFAKAKREQNA
jgi:arylsulfatase A-like enzyme